jgi:hypothetical protein
VLPCNDSVECDDFTKTTISQTEKHNNHSHETEQCTPFCICACCGTHAFQIQKAFLPSKENNIIFENEKLKTIYSFFYTKNISSKIWQPPKAS